MMAMRNSRPNAIALLSLLLAACGTDGAMESEDYGNLLNSPAGLIVVEKSIRPARPG
jgi:hypothetical protein